MRGCLKERKGVKILQLRGLLLDKEVNDLQNRRIGVNIKAGKELSNTTQRRQATRGFF